MCLQIMKSDEDVRMISAEAPVLFAKVNATTLGTMLNSLVMTASPAVLSELICLQTGM